MNATPSPPVPAPAPANRPRHRRWPWIAGALVLLFAVGLFAAYRIALAELRGRVLAALGPTSTMGEIRVSLRSLVIEDLKVRAPACWPAREALSAARVVIVPDLGSLLGGAPAIGKITVERAYLAVLRDRSGRLVVMPGLGTRAAGSAKVAKGAVPGMGVRIEEITLADATLAFFDAEVRSPPLELRLTGVGASVSSLVFPGLDGKSRVRLEGTLPGPSKGTLGIDGWMVFGTRESDLTARVRGADVAVLEPYLIRKAETGVSRGTLDLDLAARVAGQRVSAPGTLKLKNLQLRSEGGIGTFMGMPRDSVVGMLRERDGVITIPFAIEGSLSDPAFALDSAFKAKVGVATAATLGLTLAEVLGKGGSEGSGKVVEALKGLLGK